MKIQEYTIKTCLKEPNTYNKRSTMAGKKNKKTKTFGFYFLDMSDNVMDLWKMPLRN